MSEDDPSLFDYETIQSGDSLLPRRFASILNNTDNTEHLPHQRITSVVLIVLSLFGSIGNSLVCYVIASNKDMRTSVNFYLLSQAVSDTMFLLSTSYFVLYCMALRRITSNITIDVITIILRQTHYISYRASVFVIMCMAFDRYIAICHPLANFYQNRQQKTVKKLLAIWSASFCLATIHIFFVNTPTEKSWWFELFVKTEFPVITGLPLAFVAVFYTFIVFEIWKSNRFFKYSTSQNHPNEVNNVKTRGFDLSVVVILEYLVCWSPLVVFLLLLMYDMLDKSKVMRNRLYLYYGYTLFFLFNFINPFLYCLMCHKFRRAFKNLIWPQYKRCHQDGLRRDQLNTVPDSLI